MEDDDDSNIDLLASAENISSHCLSGNGSSVESFAGLDYDIGDVFTGFKHVSFLSLKSYSRQDYF